jgi:hypothetical protein
MVQGTISLKPSTKKIIVLDCPKGDEPVKTFGTIWSYFFKASRPKS